jgi:hypothetical protein
VDSVGNVYVADSNNDRISKGFPAQPPGITSALSVSGTLGLPFTYQITGSNDPASFSATGLPAWLILTGSNGTLSGTPSTSGTSNILLSATNGFGSGTAGLVLTVFNRYSAWQQENFTTAQWNTATIGGDTGTPAGDGITNLMKYALDLNPWSSGVSGLPASGTVSLSGTNYLTLTYTQLIDSPDITYTPQVSGDLKVWNSGTSYTTAPIPTGTSNGVTQTMVVRDLIPISGTNRQFMRLQVSGP